MNPEGLLSRAAPQYVEGKNLIDMIMENLVAARLAIESYRGMVAILAKRTTRPERCWNAFCRRRRSTRTTCMIGSSGTKVGQCRANNPLAN
jgi:hypothetical protein